jgi:hypothetical protein
MWLVILLAGERSFGPSFNIDAHFSKMLHGFCTFSDISQAAMIGKLKGLPFASP